MSENALRQVAEEYAMTHVRLSDDPEYRRLKAAAEIEARESSGSFFARNMFAIYIDIHTPLRTSKEES